ncbi:MAG: hypothetical protein R3D26_12925 [Cyanobacteriota/Melainabacteria group bacterium]
MISKEDDNQVERELRKAILIALDGAIAEHGETLRIAEDRAKVPSPAHWLSIKNSKRSDKDSARAGDKETRVSSF